MVPKDVLNLAAQGVRCFPCKKDHSPALSGWQEAATYDADELERFAAEFPDCNWGAVSDDIIFDLDVHDGQPNGINAWATLSAGRTPETWVARSGGGGLHLWFLLPEDIDGGNARGQLPPGIDVRGGSKGYVIIPPSVHKDTGNLYEWVNGPIGVERATAPEWALEPLKREATPPPPPPPPDEGAVLVETHPWVKGLIRGVLSDLASAPMGGRNGRLFWASRRMHEYERWIAGGGAAVVDLLVEACEANGLLGDDGLISIQKTIASGARAGRQTPMSPPDRFICTDLDNSEAFIRDHGEDVRYCYDYKAWLAWDGSRWSGHAQGIIESKAVETVKNMRHTILQIEDEKVREAAMKWAKHSRSNAKREAMITGARHMRMIRPHVLDTNPWLLNTPDGTVNLKDASIRPPAREDLITRCAAAGYDLTAKAPLWKKNLNRIFGGDQELIAFVQRALGYSLTGDISGQCFFLLVGPTGANGKSTLVGAVRRVMGDYASGASFDLFTVDKGSKNKGPGIADLNGPRLVVATEPAPGAKLDEALLKSITGGDSLRADRKYEHPFEFLPQCKLWLACNKPPNMRDGGPAMSRRVFVIPFNVQIPPKERDPKMENKLVQEGPGILAWMVAGCLSWQTEGLNPPESVILAGEDYKNESDPIESYINERITKVVGKRLSVAELGRDFAFYSSQRGIRVERNIPRWVTHAMEARGFKKTRAGGKTWILDVVLTPPEEPQASA